ncbi:hypothetical protein AK812_SmicGene31114 [Symbiodinium microadriaticum]|uniref:K Homology domain-containing protein n=1 Tax=Symbiodinium microadriaticum TaxID=2951 RepID=A0A1Q9CXK7_SYMMI|nr:hypothetical protein AK812_SmicGene31114 [Symbiodinium microadriaticum]
MTMSITIVMVARIIITLVVVVVILLPLVVALLFFFFTLAVIITTILAMLPFLPLPPPPPPPLCPHDQHQHRTYYKRWKAGASRAWSPKEWLTAQSRSLAKNSRGYQLEASSSWRSKTVNMGDADAPPFDPEERFLEISAASLEERLKVVQLVLEDLTSRAEADSQKLRLLVPTELFGSVMGHRGETLRNIIQTSRAQVWPPLWFQAPRGISVTPWEEARELEALKLVFGMLTQLGNQPEAPPVPPLPSKLGVRRPSTLGAIGSNMPLKIPVDIEIPPTADRSFTFPTDQTMDHVDNVEHMGPAAFDQLDYRDLLRSLTLGSTDYGETVRSISFDMPAGRGYGQIPPAPRLHRFHVRGKAEIFAEDGRSFTKKQKGRLSLVSEDRVHKKGVERYQVSFFSGELSRADGVGIIFSSHLPKNSDIQQIVSVFLNRTGRLCSRVNQRVIRIASTLPQIELGDVIEVENDIDMRCATFTIWSASGAAPATTVVSYVQVAEQLTATPGQSIPGHLAVVVKNPGVSVAFLS